MRDRLRLRRSCGTVLNLVLKPASVGSWGPPRTFSPQAQQADADGGMDLPACQRSACPGKGGGRPWTAKGGSLWHGVAGDAQGQRRGFGPRAPGPGEELAFDSKSRGAAGGASWPCPSRAAWAAVQVGDEAGAGRGPGPTRPGPRGAQRGLGRLAAL